MNHQKMDEKLYILPYVPGLAEYAAQVRKEILNRKNSDFILAIDLPHGLENQVMTAVKTLPKVSVIVDKLLRGIPIIPTSAPIEAVRSFQDSGIEMRFIDTSLPVTGNLDDYRYFTDQCRMFGVESVLKNAEYHGISPEDILQSWVESIEGKKTPVGFSHIPDLVINQMQVRKFDDQISPYFQARLQYMAVQLQELLRQDLDVVLVCSVSHVNGILHFLDAPLEPIDDQFIVPSRICALSEEDIFKVSPEIPFFMYLYELYRDTPIEREKWISNVFCGTDRKEIPVDTIRATQQYGHNLALTDKEIYPDIFNLVAAAKYCVDDDYAVRVFKQLKSYPPNEKISSECIVKDLSDYNFIPLGNRRSITLKVSTIYDSWETSRIRKKIFRNLRTTCYHRWARTPASQQAELDFMKYMKSRFTALRESSDDYCVQEFSSGFYDGIDVRETIRNKPFNKIYVRKPAMENRVCYVIDYRSAALPVRVQEPSLNKKSGSIQISLDNRTRFCETKIFFDKNYSAVGLSSYNGKHYINGMIVAFVGIPDDPIPMMDDLSYSRPLESAVNLGIKHAKQVFVFTDSHEDVSIANSDKKRVQVFPCSAIPPAIYEKMREFDIAYFRHENKRGD
ncbi:MAG: hypothetical protein M0Q91_10200 [Methanoregula sp.]|jgi:hypothetical protein|nr:hypothetical protein [Methanoregula sp.]